MPLEMPDKDNTFVLKVGTKTIPMSRRGACLSSKSLPCTNRLLENDLAAPVLRPGALLWTELSV